MVASIVLFGLAAVGGVALAVLQLRGRGVSPVMAIPHGLLAAAGLVVLAIVAFAGGGPGLASAAFGVLVVAALGGFVLFGRHVRNRPLPPGLVVGHGLIAVTGFVLLLIAAF